MLEQNVTVGERLHLLHDGKFRAPTKPIKMTFALAQGGPLVAAGTGYRVAYAVAEDNLNLGRTVIADAVNATRLTREAWHQIAKRAGVKCIDVVVTCSDIAQHKRRVEARSPASRGASWTEILDREFVAVDHDAIVIDTSKGPVQQCLAALQTALQARVR